MPPAAGRGVRTERYFGTANRNARGPEAPRLAADGRQQDTRRAVPVTSGPELPFYSSQRWPGELKACCLLAAVLLLFPVPVVNHLGALEGHESFLYHLVERRQECFDLLWRIHDLNHDGKILRQA